MLDEQIESLENAIAQMSTRTDDDEANSVDISTIGNDESYLQDYNDGDRYEPMEGERAPAKQPDPK
jgi:hypothetical protein